MDFSRPSKSAGELFNSLKEKISFQGRNNERDEYYEDEFYDEPQGNYGEVMVDGMGDYGPYGYDAPYNDYEYTTRSASSRGRYHSSSANLVSSEVARASASTLGLGSARLTDNSSVLASSASQAGTTERFAPIKKEEQVNGGISGYDVPATSYGDFVSPYKEPSQSTFQNSFAASASRATGEKQTGLDKLFSPTTSEVAKAPSSQVQHGSIDPYQAYENNTPYAHVPTRSVVVIKPVTYEDVEGIASAVRAGEIVALVLRITNDSLSKRVLDFSFGVASALDARVECITDKVFVVMRGTELTLEEKHELRKQGIN